MGFVTGEQELVKEIEDPKEKNPIDEEVVLVSKVDEHVVLSEEMVQDKRPWFDNLEKDMYNDSIPEIDGTRAYSEFFSMIMSPDAITSGIAAAINASHQEYVNVHDYPIYLDGDLNTDTNAKDQKTDTKSSAIIHGVLPPQTSDYFTLNTGINRTSLFKILSSKPLSIYADRAYAIEYEMEEVILGEKYDELKRKTVKELNYIRENHMIGIKYLLTSNEVRERIKDRLTFDSLYDAYVMEFYDRDNKVFGVKTDLGFHTDMIIQDFISKIAIPPEDMYTYAEYNETAKLNTIFDTLLYSRGSLPHGILTRVKYYDLRAPTDIPNIQPVLTSPITSMPFQGGSSFVDVPEPPCVNQTVHLNGTGRLGELSISNIFGQQGNTSPLLFPDVLNNSTYIFSEEFYGGEPSNKLEECIYNIVCSHSFDVSCTDELIAALYTSTKEVRFFLAPLVMVLLKVKQ